MIAYRCRKCHSTKLRKNGKTKSGQQKFHCTACNAYGTLDTQEPKRTLRGELAEQLHLERLSQRAIARRLKMSRKTIRAVLLKKSLPADRTDDHTIA